MKKVFLAIVLLCFAVSQGFAQKQEMAALHEKIRIVKNKRDQADILNRLAMLSHLRYRDSCLIYAKRAHQISGQINYKKGTADALNCFAIYYLSTNNFLSAKYFNEALAIYREIGDLPNQAQMYMNLSVLFFIDKNEREAIKYIYKADRMMANLPNDSIRSIILSDILTIDKKLTPKQYQVISDQGFAIAKKYKDQRMIVSYENNRGTALYNEGKKEEGLRVLMESLKMADNAGCIYVKVSAIMTIGEMYLDLKQYDAGVKYYEEGLAISQQYGYPERYAVFAERLYAHFKSQKDLERALEYATLLLDNQYKVRKSIQQSGYNYVNYVSKEIENSKLKDAHDREIKTNITLLVIVVILLLLLLILWKLYRSKKDFAAVQEQLHHIASQRNGELEEQNRFKAMIIGVLAHDIRQPFSNIIMASSLFDQDDALNESEKKFVIKELEATAKQSLLFMDGILEWVKSKNLGHAFALEPVNLHALAMEANSFFIAAQRRKNITFSLSIPTEITVNSNEMVLSFVLRNLFNNATKYSQRGTSISVSGIKEANKVLLTVSDTGRGMTSTQQTQLFKIAQPDGDKANDTGAGIALTMSYEMLEKIGASISVESTFGSGSSFIIEIPS